MKRLACALALGGCAEGDALRPAAPEPELAPAPAASLLQGLPSTASGAAVFERIASVLLHPRCTNCHPTAARPQQRLRAADPATDHAMRVARGDNGGGSPAVPCRTCHQARNAPGTRAPPGAHGWRLAPASMGWSSATPAALCRQLKDTRRTGGRDLSAVIRHVATDPLVGWAYDPGDDRPAPPGTLHELVVLLALWQALGAPCPAPR